MLDIHQVLKRPILSEKSTRFTDSAKHPKYVFEVAREANKILVRQAVETLFGVKVDKVNIRNRKGKRKRVGRSVGFGKDRKEAVVTLKAGQQIEIY